jgi:hypothetical protein
MVAPIGLSNRLRKTVTTPPCKEGNYRKHASTSKDRAFEATMSLLSSTQVEIKVAIDRERAADSV